MRVTHLDVVTEHIIISNFQAGNAGQLAFALLNLEQAVFPRISNPTQFIQFFVYPVGYHPAFVDQQRRIIFYFFGYLVANGNARIQLLANAPQALVISVQASIFDGFDGLQRHFQLYHFARRDAPYGGFRNDAFQIAYPMQLFFYEILEIGFAEEVVYHVQTLVDGFHVFQGEYNPPLQQAGSHRTDGVVNNIQQARTTIIHTAQQFQTSDSEFIQAHIAVFLNTRKRSDMAYLVMLGHIEVL